MRDTMRTSGEAKGESPEGLKTSPDRDSPDMEKQNNMPAYNRETHGRVSNYDREDPFGDEENAEVKYRTMKWWQASAIMIAETISLGILSLPSVLATVGLVGGLITLIGLGLLATYTGYVLGQFKARYPFVANMADAGEVLMGPFGRELFGIAQVLFLVFLSGSHILTWTIAFNTMTGHPTCTIVWAVVGLVIFFIFTLPRTLEKVSYLAIASFISIFSAVLITMIGIGIDRPDQTIQATTTVSFATAFGSITNIIFAYAGHVAFFSFIAELRDPADFPKALYCLQAWDISMYVAAAVVIYYYGGPDVASPSLGSTSPILRKVAYGIALPTIVIAGIIVAHVGIKYIYVRIFRGTKHMQERTWLSIGTWVGITLVFWVIAFVIAESIPVFNDLLGLISALFASWFTYGLSGIFWLFLNWGQWFSNWKKICLTMVNMFCVVIGAAICGIGLYASGVSIHDNAGQGASWSCANNGV